MFSVKTVRTSPQNRKLTQGEKITLTGICFQRACQFQRPRHSTTPLQSCCGSTETEGQSINCSCRVLGVCWGVLVHLSQLWTVTVPTMGKRGKKQVYQFWTKEEKRPRNGNRQKFATPPWCKKFWNLFIFWNTMPGGCRCLKPAPPGRGDNSKYDHNFLWKYQN